MDNKEKPKIGNSIGNEGAKSIGDSLKINTSLTVLNLDSDERIRNEKRINHEQQTEYK